MKPSSLRFWFCVAVAVIAAAVADPCVEAVSNAGLFGRARLTDGSNSDVVPALCIGLAFILLYFVLRVRSELLRASGCALRDGHARLLLPTFAMQIAVLFGMETLEQLVVIGHPLGGLIWLGGPIAFSLIVHALACVGLVYGLAALLRLCTRRTLHVIRLIRALVERCIHGDAPIALPVGERTTFARPAPVLCRIGNRAPPVVIA